MTRSELPPWSAFRDALAQEGFRPSKSRGQNFLVDPNMARAIAADAGVGAGDFVLEVGPGCGMLSVPLAARGVRLVAVEIDERLARVAARFLAPFPLARVLVGDALAGKQRLSEAVEACLPRAGAWHVVANLPYAIVGPLVAVLARRRPPPETMTVLVQRELARRVAAAAGDPERGALSARVQALYAARVGRAVGRQLFRPRPRVESAVLELRRRPPRPGLDLAALDALIDALFAHRRRQIGGLLRERLELAAGEAERWLGGLGLDPTRRAEELSGEDLERLAEDPLWRGRRPAEPD